jgi:chemotaxis protein MotB
MKNVHDRMLPALKAWSLHSIKNLRKETAMKYVNILCLAVAAAALVTGCVSTKKYDASLAEINTLETEKAGLEERLYETRNRLSEESAARSTLEDEAAALRDEVETLKRQRDSLFELNTDLNNAIASLSDEKLNVMKEKENTIAKLLEENRNALEKLAEEKQRAIREKEHAMAEMKQTYDSLVSELNDEIKKGEIAVTQLKDKLSLSMVEKILFDSGSADIKQNGKAVLDRVAEILRKVTDRQIRIEGHTDNVPIGAVLAAKFPTNWELSTARSTTVVRYLQDKGIDPALLSATGYSEYSPVASNETDEGKAKNRRIEIVLIPLDVDRIITE